MLFLVKLIAGASTKLFLAMLLTSAKACKKLSLAMLLQSQSANVLSPD